MELHLTQAGVEAAPILFLHGIASSGQLFEKRFGELGSQHNLLFPDLLGFGSSPRPDQSDYNAKEHAVALAQTLQVKASGQLNEGLTIVAHSAGCLVALTYATIYPQYVKQLILFNPTFYWSADEAYQITAKHSILNGSVLKHPHLAKLACLSLCSTGLISHVGPYVLRNFPIDAIKDAPRHSWNSLSRTLNNTVVHYDLAATINKLKERNIPILIVMGEQDKLVGLAQIQPFVASMPNTRVHRIAADHYPFFRQAKLCLEVIRERLN